MELPIQLKFFKKLELYQELRYQNKKIAKNPDLENIWKDEKEILKWMALNHHCMGESVTNEFIIYNIFKVKKEQNENSKEVLKRYEKNLSKTFKNLAKRGYGKLSKQRGDEIFFEKEGLLMGEVISDVEGKNFLNKYKYPFLYYLTWLTALSGAFSVIIIFINLLIPIICKMVLILIFDKFDFWREFC